MSAETLNKKHNNLHVYIYYLLITTVFGLCFFDLDLNNIDKWGQLSLSALDLNDLIGKISGDAAKFLNIGLDATIYNINITGMC